MQKEGKTASGVCGDTKHPRPAPEKRAKVEGGEGKEGRNDSEGLGHTQPGEETSSVWQISELIYRDGHKQNFKCGSEKGTP